LQKVIKEEDEMETGKIDTSTATSPSVDRQANIVADLMKEGAYDIAKSFIDFIKQKKTQDEPSEEED